MTTTDPITAAYAHHRAGRRSEAEEILRRVLEREPRHPGALHLLGLMAHAQGRLGPGVQLMRRAVALAPDVPDYHNNLGAALADAGRLFEAEESFAAATRLNGDYLDAWRNLAQARVQLNRLDEAAEAYRRVVALAPGDEQAIENLIALCHATADAAGALHWRRRSLALSPDNARRHSDLLVLMHYLPEVSPQERFDEHVRWAQRHAGPLKGGSQESGVRGQESGVRSQGSGVRGSEATPHEIDRSTDRPLRVGYLSGDFRDHPVARYILPILKHHDRSRVTAVCYSDVAQPDEVTERVNAHADEWCCIANATDAEAADLVRRDRIDILIDLVGHMDQRRLLVFARRPAPVQMTWAGYPGTTGMRQMDYRITDAQHDPPGETERFHTERLIRLPNSCLVYDPGDDLPETGPPPFEAAGHVTFGSINRLPKLTPQVLQTWARVMNGLPDSRLLVLCETDGGNAALRSRFERHGIPAGRIDFIGRRPRRQFLELFQRIDIVLDPFPYNGETTSFDALWMAVPVITLAGADYGSRAGLNLLRNIGLGDLVATSVEDYTAIAASLARDRDRLRQMRAGLRVSVQASPLSDGKAFTAALERAYEDAWCDVSHQTTARCGA